MFGGGGGSAQPTPKVSALAVQTAGYGVPIQISYGTVRVSPTLGFADGFVATKHKRAGGKGFGGGDGSYYYTYTSSVELFVCEGPIKKFGRIWRDAKIYGDYTKAGLSHRLGVYPQATFSSFDTAYQEKSLPYHGIALLAALHYNLKDGATLGNHAVEVARFVGDEGDQNEKDAYIADIIPDFLTNIRYGAIDAQTAEIPLETSAMHDYCRARGILISPVISEKKPAHEYLAVWSMVANASPVWSEGILKFKPRADRSVSGYGATYTAETVIRYHFDSDDDMSDWITPTTDKDIDRYNLLPVECLNRGKNYNKHSFDVPDQANISDYGERKAATLTIDCVCVPRIAAIVGHTELNRILYLGTTYDIKSSWLGRLEDVDLLEPMDFVTVTEPYLGMISLRMRVLSITDDQNGDVVLTVEEAPEGAYYG